MALTEAGTHKSNWIVTEGVEAGDLLIERNGTQFVSRDLGRFFGGVETSTDWTGETQDSDDTPVRFIRPGEPGFGSTTPDYDCNMQMVGLTLRTPA